MDRRHPLINNPNQKFSFKIGRLQHRSLHNEFVTHILSLSLSFPRTYLCCDKSVVFGYCTDDLYFLILFKKDSSLNNGIFEINLPFFTIPIFNYHGFFSLNDLSGQKSERVAAMEKEWFRMAEHVDRLKGRALAPVGESVKSLSFRKDTSSGSATKENRNKKK